MKKTILVFAVILAVLLIFAACTDHETTDSAAPSNGLPEPVNTKPVSQSQEASKTDSVSEAPTEHEENMSNVETLPDTSEDLEIDFHDETEDSDEEGQGLEIVDEVIVDVSGDIIIGGN